MTNADEATRRYRTPQGGRDAMAVAMIAEAEMVADPSAAERAYQRLRHDILNGVLPTGPLDLKSLGDRLRMSVTPIREALARLNAERLVKLAPHYGYAVAVPSVRRLQDIYWLAGSLINLSLEHLLAQKPEPQVTVTAHSSATYAEAITDLMASIALAQMNIELSEHVLALNDRLRSARRCEPLLFPGAERETVALRALWNRQAYAVLRRCLHKHYELRVSRVDAIARLLTEQTGEP